MACSRGRAHPNSATKLKLFTDSAGYCQNPNCNVELFPREIESFGHIAEMAHIFAATDGGPRTNAQLTEEERGAYNNLVLLCSNCHSMVDKAPEEFTPDVLSFWKQSHRHKLELAFGLSKLETRSDLRRVIEPLLVQNRTIHKKIGPDNDYKYDPEATEAFSWKERVKRTIIPNSMKILMIVEANLNLLNGDEIDVISDFRFHVEGLIMKHIDGVELANSRFPEKMNTLAEAARE